MSGEFQLNNNVLFSHIVCCTGCRCACYDGIDAAAESRTRRSQKVIAYNNRLGDLDASIPLIKHVASVESVIASCWLEDMTVGDR